MSEFKICIGSWDDDFEGNWHGDNPPQPKEDPNELKDTSIMQWGTYHKGKPMSKVPKTRRKHGLKKCLNPNGICSTKNHKLTTNN